MKSLREEMNEVLDVFDACDISEDEQKDIINEGVYFCFSNGIDIDGIDRQYDCFKFARFLKFCIDNGIELDVNKLLKELYGPKYMELVHAFDEIDGLIHKKKNLKNR